jgi:hypothetical protein
VSDLVSLLLEAIKQVEQIARECGDADDRRWKWDLHAETVRTESGDYVACGPWDCDVPGNYALHMVTNDPNVILRRCQADRQEVELHHIVWRDIGWLEWDEGEHAEMYEELPVCGLCVPKHSSFPTRADVPEGPCQTIRLRARAYGLEVK